MVNQMNSSELRQAFLDYFAAKGHEVVHSSPLIPANDATLLFTNAGMVQFKEAFLGLEQRPYSTATSTQKCVRAGGKHNDLENVGYTARHHTFFEMLGNFSFGDYFKEQAIEYAWDFLTNVLKLPKEKLWITVFEDDKESEDIWFNKIKIDQSRFSRCGEKDNFWSMGDTGPCGPCTEIFYDHGPDIPGGPPGSPEQEGDRYVEIWNLVFMQYDRSQTGELSHLPKPSVDTGMGLERIAAVMQGVSNNYDIDIFKRLISVVAKLAGQKDHTHVSLRVIADHIRSCAFLITDGVMPANEGRGYVLRRIIRRAVRHGHQLGLREPFFFKLVQPLVDEMGDAFPELAKAQKGIEKALLKEEKQFAKTLEQGLKILEDDLSSLKGKVIPGATMFKLYDTYGFPVDLTGDIARERGYSLDMEGFELAMARQRQLSQEASKFVADYSERMNIDVTTDFTGYEFFEHEATVLKIIQDSEAMEQLAEGQNAAVVLDRSPFYAEGGGQVGDVGQLNFGDIGVFKVTDTKKHGDAYLHFGEVVKGTLKVGDKVFAAVDVVRRKATMLNHTATHLLHAALREELGEHVLQKGSLVEANRLRFDFAHYEAVTSEQLRKIERIVNREIRANSEAHIEIQTPKQAQESGALALFGEKYGDKVRVLSYGKFSKELCGGTHVERTGDIGFFKITSENGIASGVRRVEAITGEKALDWLENAEQQLNQVGKKVKANWDEVSDKVEQVVASNRKLEKEVARLQTKLASSAGTDLASQAEEINGVKVLAIKLESANAKTMRDTLDHLKNKLGTAAIVLASVNNSQVSITAGITKDSTSRLNAGELVNYVAQQVGGKGGGRADMAQAGGTEPENLDSALQSVHAWVAEKLAS